MIEPRFVTPDRAGAYDPVAEDERFDVIFCNPPWDVGQLEHLEDHLDVDVGGQLIQSLLAGLDRHLAPGGKLVLMYGPVDGLRFVWQEVQRTGWQADITFAGGRESLGTFLERDEPFDPDRGVPPLVTIWR